MRYEMSLDRRLAEEQSCGDVPVAVSLGEQPYHLGLPLVNCRFRLGDVAGQPLGGLGGENRPPVAAARTARNSSSGAPALRMVVRPPAGVAPTPRGSGRVRASATAGHDRGRPWSRSPRPGVPPAPHRGRRRSVRSSRPAGPQPDRRDSGPIPAHAQGQDRQRHGLAAVEDQLPARVEARPPRGRVALDLAEVQGEGLLQLLDPGTVLPVHRRARIPFRTGPRPPRQLERTRRHARPRRLSRRTARQQRGRGVSYSPSPAEVTA